MNDIEMRVKLFNMIRDIPYHISIHGEQDYSCAVKPFLLDCLLRDLGMEAQRILCQFRWSDLGLPEHIIDIPHDDLETHEYLNVKIPETGQWIKVDPTWDSKIMSPAIITPVWDGLSDTAIAVPIVRTWSPQDSLGLIAEEDATSDAERAQFLEKNGEFYNAFNQWLDSLRVSE